MSVHQTDLIKVGQTWTLTHTGQRFITETEKHQITNDLQCTYTVFLDRNPTTSPQRPYVAQIVACIGHPGSDKKCEGSKCIILDQFDAKEDQVGTTDNTINDMLIKLKEFCALVKCAYVPPKNFPDINVDEYGM